MDEVPYAGVSKNEEEIKYNYSSRGEIDPAYKLYQLKKWKVCFPERKEVEGVANVWYICNNETKEVHRLMVEKALAGLFGIFYDGNLLAVINGTLIGRCSLRRHKKSPIRVECENAEIFGKATFKFTIEGRQYELIRNGYKRDIYTPSLHVTNNLFIDGFEISENGDRKVVKPMNSILHATHSITWATGYYSVVIVSFVFPLLAIIFVLYYVGMFSYDRLNRHRLVKHCVLPRPEIESIIVSSQQQEIMGEKEEKEEKGEKEWEKVTEGQG